MSRFGLVLVLALAGCTGEQSPSLPAAPPAPKPAAPATEEPAVTMVTDRIDLRREEMWKAPLPRELALGSGVLEGEADLTRLGWKLKKPIDWSKHRVAFIFALSRNCSGVYASFDIEKVERTEEAVVVRTRIVANPTNYKGGSELRFQAVLVPRAPLQVNFVEAE